MVDIGKYIWVDDKDYLFLPGKIIEIEDNSYKVLVEIDGESETRTVEMDKYSEVHPSCLKGVDDLLLLVSKLLTAKYFNIIFVLSVFPLPDSPLIIKLWFFLSFNISL